MPYGEKEFYDEIKYEINPIDLRFCKDKMPVRKEDVHKGTCGRVLLIGGRGNMSGALILSAKAALYSGVGLVYINSSEDNNEIVRQNLPQCIFKKDSEVLVEYDIYDSIAIGMGFGRSKESYSILKTLLESYDKTLVIDADGLNLISMHEELKALLRNFKGKAIITPHKGEAQRLGVLWNSFKERDVTKLADMYGCIAVRKGPKSMIADGKNIGIVYENTSGNNSMARGGSGDVLSGIISALGAGGLSPMDAACVGVFVHGLAGDICREKMGRWSTNSLDIANFVPDAFSMLEN